MERRTRLAEPQNRPYNYRIMGEEPSNELSQFLRGLEHARPRVEGKGEQPKKIEGMEARLAYLQSLPAEGFKSEEEKQKTIEQIAEVGFPIDNYKKLVSKRNGRGREEKVYASWGIGSKNYGEYIRYDLLDKEVPQKQLGTTGHEGAHAASPFDTRNKVAYPNPESRKEAQQVAIGIAEQTLTTEIALNGYHQWLMEEMKYYEEHGKPRNKDEQIIDRAVFYEETHAIASELGLSNRKRLEMIQKSQHDELDNMAKLGLVDKQKKVYLLTSPGEDDVVRVAGIDKTLITLLDGVNNYEDLVNHVDKLKEKFYPAEDLNKARQRGTARPILAMAA
jgi:hypothetical protein